MAVNNSIKVGPLVFLLYMFEITGNIMKRPVQLCAVVQFGRQARNFRSTLLSSQGKGVYVAHRLRH